MHHSPGCSFLGLSSYYGKAITHALGRKAESWNRSQCLTHPAGHLQDIKMDVEDLLYLIRTRAAPS